MSDEFDVEPSEAELSEAWQRLPEGVADRIASLARRHVKANAAKVSFCGVAQFERAVSPPPPAFVTAPPYDPACREVHLSGDIVVADDVASHPLLSGLQLAPDVKSYVGVPLRLATGEIHGVLAVTDLAQRHWSEDDVALVVDLGACLSEQFAASLEAVRREETDRLIRQRHEQLLDLLDNISGLVFERRKTGTTTSQYTIYGSRKATSPAVRHIADHGEFETLDFIQAEDREAVRAALLRSLTDETDLDLTFRLAGRGRNARWIRTHLVRRREPGRPAIWDGVAFDVTDLVAARETAETAQIGRETAIVNANHEMRTPLQAIIGFSEFMKGETRPEVMAEHAKAIQSAADGLLSVVNLQLDRAGGGAVTDAATRIALRPFVETCLSLVGPLALDKGLTAHLTIDADVPEHVLLDWQKVQQIILNLLNNAVKYTDQGSYTLAIGRTIGRELRFAVTDTGLGIPADKKPLLFHRFSRLQRNEGVSGSGLGLYLAKTIVEGLRGRIEIAETIGRGTTIWFEIPLLEADDPGVPEDAGSDEPEAQADALPEEDSARILLADDLDLNRRLIADMLSLEGYTVDCVADGAAAVKAASENSYDLILMDMIMPGMDGIAATRAIRALPAPSSSVPIVALTANSFREQLDSCLNAGMDATLTKPMSVEALTRAVHTWTRGRKAA